MKVVLTEAAISDLCEIGDVISLHNPKRAGSFVEELLQRCDGLADMAKAFPLIPRYEQHGIRRAVHRDYLIFYRIQSETVEVLHIMNGARDYERLLFDGPSEAH